MMRLLFLIAMLLPFSAYAIGEPLKTPLQSYGQARMLWMNYPYVKEAPHPKYIGKSEAYAAGMEFTIVDAAGKYKKVLVMGGSEGDASVYFQSNNPQGLGGWIGGIDHAETAKAGVNMVAIASNAVSLMNPTKNFPYVRDGAVRFIVMTKKGFYTQEVSEREVRDPGHKLYGLYASGQQVISAYRVLQGK